MCFSALPVPERLHRFVTLDKAVFGLGQQDGVSAEVLHCFVPLDKAVFGLRQQDCVNPAVLHCL